MKINRNNYEAYFIDYIEGNLDEKLVDDFLEFLEQNPDLKDELSIFQSVSLEPEEIQFNKKEKLYKNKFDLEDHFNHTSVAAIEGDLNNDEKEAFESYLNSHPDKRKEYNVFEKTKLHPDLAVQFNKKSGLYHRSAGRSVMMWSLRIAAVFILVFTSYLFIQRYSVSNMNDTRVTVVENETSKNETLNKETENKETYAEPEQNVVIQEEEGEKFKTIATIVQVKKPVKNKIINIPEENIEKMKEEDIVIERTRPEALLPIPGLTASLEINQPQTVLKTVQYKISTDPVNSEEERFLADAVIEKTGIDKLSFNKIAKVGLNIVSNISKDKLTYQTSDEGKVTEINYDSRLFAFSIPTRGDTNK